jgi:23S rRNA pseudouridine1911/1915/1917 synthase
MAATVPGYRNMDRFFIRLKAGESVLLSELLQKHLRATPDEAQQLLRQGSVWDNDRKVRLRDGRLAITSELVRVDRPKFSIREYALVPEDIKYEDDHLLIVYKRGGVPAQPTPYSDIDNLLHGVQKHFTAQRLRYRAAPVNRLDLPAQGLVPFAKNKRCEVALHRLFEERRIRKRYLAATVAFAGVKPSYIIRSELEWQGRSRVGLTYVRFCREKDGRFFFLAFPQSGRTHQIRRHFQEQVASLIGDVRYGGAEPGRELWLLCFQYVFPHPVTREKISVRFVPAAWREAMGLVEEE